tara:strand:- start:1178 stop:1399 length:222 start_codon:yes stop_codon:yes gene_type:complete
MLKRHLRDVEEGYFEHMGHSLGFAVRLLFASLALFVHAFLPFLFKEFGSNQVAKVVNKLTKGKRGEVFNRKIN